MRLRLAPLVAAAVIFAPGWYGQTPPQDPRGFDVAARVLAPTGDEVALRDAEWDGKRQISGRQGMRWRPGITEVVASFGIGLLALVIFWVVGFYPRPVFGRYRFHSRFCRPPPHLQPA